MKKLTYLLFCLILGIGMATAQTTKVTGTVISRMIMSQLLVHRLS